MARSLKIIIKSLFAATLFAGCGENPVAPEPYSGTIPVATGNTWVYQHDYDYYQYDYNNRDSLVSHQNRQGLLTLSITDVNSTSFTVRSVDIDSGGVNTKTYGLPIFTGLDYTHYGQPVPPTMPTNIFTFSDYYASFMRYVAFPDTSISSQQITMALRIYNYSLQTEITPVSINGGDRSMLYSRIIKYSKLNSVLQYDDLDTSQWLDGVGIIHNSHTTNYYGEWTGTTPYTQTIEHFSLISFNGSPVTVSK